MDDIYRKIESFPYKEKSEAKINTEKYLIRIRIELFFESAEGTDQYTLFFYSYGVKKGYFLLENGDITMFQEILYQQYMKGFRLNQMIKKGKKIYL